MTQLVWLPDRRRYVGTQGEAKQLKVPFEVRDIATDKAGLMEHLNNLEEEREQAATTPASETISQGGGLVEIPKTGTPMERLQAAARKIGWVPAEEAAAPKEAATPKPTAWAFPVATLDAAMGQEEEAPKPKFTPGTEAMLSRIDNPGIDVDRVVEIIGNSGGWALRRYSGAVAVAFHMLEGSGKKATTSTEKAPK